MKEKIKNHKIDCAVNSSEVADEFSVLGCTCKDKHAQALVKKRWDKTTSKERKAYSEKMINARVKKYGQKRRKTAQQDKPIV